MNKPSWIGEVKEVTAEEASLLLALGADVWADHEQWDPAYHPHRKMVSWVGHCLAVFPKVALFYIRRDEDGQTTVD